MVGGGRERGDQAGGVTAPPLLAPLADWAATGAEAAGEDARARVAMATLDWFGALAAGRVDGAAPLYAGHFAAMAGGPGAEAFRLGTLSHLAEVDDGHRAAMLHPGVVTFAPIFAVGRDVTVARFRAAVVAGYEASVRVGAAFGPAHYRVFHSTGTAGAFGAAAAAGVRAALNAAEMLHAFGHAGTQAAGLWQFADDGAEPAKAAHAGFAAQAGLAAASLAASGVPGAARVIEGPRGLAVAWGLDVDTAPLLTPFEGAAALMGATVKAWPVCGQMHHVLDAVTGIAPEGIERVEIESFAALERIAGLRDPATAAQARFSTPWCVARVILRADLGFRTLEEPGVLDDAQVAALAARVVMRTAPEFDAAFPARRGARVTVRRADGSGDVVEHWGRRGDPERSFSPPEMRARFAEIAGGADDGWRRDVLDFVDMLEHAGGDDMIPAARTRRLTDG